uniref:V(D)J recombination-activating protein 1 n=1 Tax=Branchiostoma belcheri TaxID=7741 RepID=A0A185KID9_BRABE|nr:RAG1L [Branchiostoma belcheri]
MFFTSSHALQVSQMEEHKEYLKTVCRVCKLKLVKGWNAKVLKFADVIRQTFDVDVSQDSPDVHPQFVCNKCRLKLQRKSKAGTGIASMAIFQPHTTGDCHCKRRRGRPTSSNTTSQPPSADVGATTSQHPTADVRATTSQPPTADVRATTSQPPTADVRATTSQPPTADVRATTSQPPTADVRDTTSQPPTADVRATTSQPPTADVRATTSQPPTADVRDTTSQPPSADVRATTSQPPTADVRATTSQPPTADVRATTSQPPSNDVRATTSQPPTADVRATTSQPPTADVRATTSQPPTADVRATTSQPPTADVRATTSQPGQNYGMTYKRKLFDESSEVESGAATETATEFDSMEVGRFVDEAVAFTFLCAVCHGVPCKSPVISNCQHIYCGNCIDFWLKRAGVCPSCRGAMTLDEDVNPLTGHLLNVYDTLKVRCKYYANGCEVIEPLQHVGQHEVGCVKTRPTPESLQRKRLCKARLYDVTRHHVKHKRLKPLIEHIDEYCNEKDENKGDVLFFLLRSHLYDTGNRSMAEQIDTLWHGESLSCMTPEECLGMRLDMLMTKNQYSKEYNILKERGFSTLCPPKQLDAIEKTLMPGTARYSIEGMDYSEHYFHSPVKMTGDLEVHSGETLEPDSVTMDFHEYVPDFPCPNTKGVRFPYAHAVAKTLEELEDEIVNGLKKLGRDPNDPTLVIHTICKDGADGMGDVSVHKEKSDHLLPDKALRFSFCVLRCSVMHKDTEVTIYEDPNPNSVRSNRPVLECIGDENDDGTVAVCVGPIECQRLLMKDKIMRVHMSDGTQRAHYLTFFNSMVDEKWDRAHGGLAGAGSKYLCTLCEAVRDEALEKAGSYKITRTLKKIEVTASKMKYESQEKDTFGVKGYPLLTTEPWERGIDATHTDINMGNYFKSLIVREMAQVHSWAKTANVKKQIVDAESKLDKHLKESLGLNPTLMMAGNYARELFKAEHADKLVALVDKPDRKSALVEVLAKFRQLRKVYRANWPLNDMSDEVRQYKAKAVEMANDLKTHFPYAPCTNYLHKVIEHVQELIEHPSGVGSVGALSSEGNEAGNKLFRQLRLGHARKGNTYNGLRDVLCTHWLYTSKTLRDKAAVTERSLCCGRCGGVGHNVRTCTADIESDSN